MSKDVEFQDVFYTVKNGYVRDSTRKCLLQGVSGYFKNGQLSAIMGSSGAGKSSLLNVLSGLRTSGVNGHILRNKKSACYLTQEDHHQLYLSLGELMKMACNLKLKQGIPHEPIIEDILTNLNLNHRRNVYANELSGGEKRRLSIALELVANPTIFYLDEPTSGLDEVTALQCIRVLKNLSTQGKTIICTIHQPSPIMFSLFNQIFVMSKGQCVYQGEPQTLVPYLSYLNLACPKHYSPADYIIELCENSETNVVPILTNMVQNGKLMCTHANNNYIDNYDNITTTTTTTPLTINNIIIDNNKSTKFLMKNATTSIILEKTVKSKGGALLEKMKKLTKFIKNDNATVSQFRQFCVLFQIMLLKIMRNKAVLILQLCHHIFCGTVIGLIFFKSANDGERMFDHLKLCLGLVFFFTYTQIIVPVLAYPSEVKVVKKECFYRWYSLMPYYIAYTLSRLPCQIIFNLIFLTITYWMVGLPHEAFRFVLFIFIGMIISFVAEGLGLAIGATFSITNGTVVGPLIMAPLLGLAIYGFDFAADIPLFMYALMKLSFIRVGIVSLVLCVFGYNRAPLDCKDMYCHFDDPNVLLRFVRIETVNVWHEIGFLIMYLVLFRTIFYLSLKRRCVY